MVGFGGNKKFSAWELKSKRRDSLVLSKQNPGILALASFFIGKIKCLISSSYRSRSLLWLTLLRESVEGQLVSRQKQRGGRPCGEKLPTTTGSQDTVGRSREGRYSSKCT